MKAKEYLRQLSKLRSDLQRRMNHAEVLRTDITYMKGMSYDGVRVQTSPTGESLPQRQVEELADLEKQIAVEMVEYHKLRYKITREIEQLPDERFREILALRYVEGESLEEVAAEMGYSYDWARRLHGYALCSFQKEIGDA